METCAHCGRSILGQVHRGEDNAALHWKCVNAHNSEARAQSDDGAESVIVTTTHTVTKREIAYEIDIVTSESVIGVNIFRDIFSGVRDIVGGRAQAQQKVLREMRSTCLRELRLEALEIGADAVVGVDLDYSEISGGGKNMLMLVASGTAVKLEQSE